MWVYSLRDKSFSDDFISLFFCYIGCTSTNKFNKQKKQVFFFFFSSFSNREQRKNWPEGGKGLWRTIFWFGGAGSQRSLIKLFTQLQTHNVLMLFIECHGAARFCGLWFFAYLQSCLWTRMLSRPGTSVIELTAIELFSTDATSSWKPFRSCEFGPGALLLRSHYMNP